MGVVVVIGAGQIGQAIARRVAVGKHLVLADRSEANANAAAVLPTVTFMTTKAAEPIDLPAPVAAYFAADTTGAEAVAQCFTDGAVVIDERQEYRGRTAIARWKAEASAKFRYTVDRLGAHVSGDQTTVTGRVRGDFPGSPVDLQYRFTLEGDKIARLEITP